MLIRLSFILIILFGNQKISAQNFDINLLKEINLHRNTSFDKPLYQLDKAVYALSVATPLSMLAVGIIKHDQDLKTKSLNVGVSLVGSMASTYILKKSIQRERPYLTYPVINNYSLEDSYSMPSGHTTAAFSTATSLTLAYPKWYVAVPAFTYASVVAYSRLHLGVHYPSDVFIGALIGSGGAFLTHKAQKWINKRRK